MAEIDKRYAKSTMFYPPWRKPFVKPSFVVANWLVRHGLKNPQRISYLMILLSFLGGSLFFFDDIKLNLVGCCILIFSYFLDMLDGKTSKLLNKPYKGLIGYLDNQFHVPITAYIIFLLGLRLYLSTNNIWYLFLGFFTSWIFLWKTEMQFSYEIHMLEVRPVEDLTMYEEKMSYNTYHTLAYDLIGIKKWLYIGVRPILDATDIWFALIPVTLLHIEIFFLVILFLTHIGVFIMKVYKQIKDLEGTNETKKEQNNLLQVI